MYETQIESFRKKLRSYNFNFATCTPDKMANWPPKLIVVADEIFNMSDALLSRIARTVAPSFSRNQTSGQA